LVPKNCLLSVDLHGIADGMDFSPSLGMEVGIARAQRFTPSSEISTADPRVTRGSATALDTARAAVWRASLGMDFAVSDRMVIQVSASHLGPVGKDSAPSMTRRSSIDSVLVGVLVHF
jgi:hypothetical protein